MDSSNETSYSLARKLGCSSSYIRKIMFRSRHVAEKKPVGRPKTLDAESLAILQNASTNRFNCDQPTVNCQFIYYQYPPSTPCGTLSNTPTTNILWHPLTHSLTRPHSVLQNISISRRDISIRVAHSLTLSLTHFLTHFLTHPHSKSFLSTDRISR